MKKILQIISIIILVILLVSSFYVVFSFAGNKKENDIVIDSEKPVIKTVTGDTSGTSGKITTIVAEFSDNLNVTNATIFYKKEDSSEWISKSILNGSYELVIPKTYFKNYYYYITVNDKAGNGPVGNPSLDGSSYYIVDVEEDIEKLVHNVFIEEGTATWCHNCPTVANNLHDIYESEEYNFYYVSMIQDKNTVAKNRLEKDYNILGYPSIYVDGGYDILVGEKEKSEIIDKISKAANRDVPKIRINVSSELEENISNIKTTVKIKNFEDDTYSGRLKLYLTERNSYQYFGGTGNYHFGFVKYLYNELIDVDSKEEKIIINDLDVGSYDPANLMIIGVLFDSESLEKYSGSDSQNPFDAYFAHGCDGSLVLEDGNLKPNLGITNPINARLHLFGKEIGSTFRLNTILIGRTKIQVQATDDSSIEKVEFYINGELVDSVENAPYEYLWKSTPFLKFRHEIKVIAYDDEGKSSEETMDVIAFILF